MSAKDFLGNDLTVGDEIIFTELRYRNFLRGKVKKLTPQMVFIEYDCGKYGSTIIKQAHEQVIKVEK